MVGQTLGHFRILEKVGAGGMGVVYRAHDERLDRDVALKVLPAGTLADEAARKRFRKEALALSKLNHPNIETVHDFDTQDGADFLVMEYIPGITLSDKLAGGPLPEKEILRIGTQLAEGLSAAHEQNIIHRDLKPGNLRIMPDGRLKILDFGLAKLVRPLSEADLTASVSETHAVAGTLPYMAPEQLQGAPVDARTDIYAAGTVLYEMATGQLPFHEKLSTSLADAILHKPAPPPGRLKTDLSSRLEEMILKCMEKDPENRYQSAKDVLVDLRRLSTHEVPRVAPRRAGLLQKPTAALVGVLALLILATASYFTWRHFWTSAKPPAGKIMLAVLPFENLSADPEQEYFSDGLTEEMIAQLGSLQPQRLGVIARTSAMRYKKTEKSVDQIGRELNVAYVLEGSVRKAGTRVRVTAQLIQVSDQTHLWAENYEKDLADVFGVQNEVAHRIARSLELELLSPQKARLAATRPAKPEAHEAYLKGRYYWNKRTQQDFKEAIKYFQHAVDIDSRYALAYAGIADSYNLLSAYGNVSPHETSPLAKLAVTKALYIDDTLSESHASLAWVKFDYDWDWFGAEKEFRRAIELNRGYATAHHWYAFYLSAMGRHDEGIAEIDIARQLDPLSPIINARVGYLLFCARRYDLAVEQHQKALELDPNFPEAHHTLGLVFEQKRMYEQAAVEFQKAINLSEGNARYTASLGHVNAVAGKRTEALKLLYELRELSKKEYVSPLGIALVYVGLGENNQTFAWLKKAYEEHDSWLVRLRVDPRVDGLRTDPRFQDLLRRMNFPQ